MEENGIEGRVNKPVPGRLTVAVQFCIGTCVVALGFIYGYPILFPRQLGHRTPCLSLVKQMALGALMYANDYDNLLPGASTWMDDLHPYTKTETIFHDIPFVSAGDYGYAFRERANGLNETKVDSPNEFILLFDSMLVGRNAHSEPWSLPIPGRHNGSDMLAFVDGHARGFTTIVENGSPHASLPLLQTALQADDVAFGKTIKH